MNFSSNSIVGHFCLYGLKFNTVFIIMEKYSSCSFVSFTKPFLNEFQSNLTVYGQCLRHNEEIRKENNQDIVKFRVDLIIELLFNFKIPSILFSCYATLFRNTRTSRNFKISKVKIAIIIRIQIKSL